MKLNFKTVADRESVEKEIDENKHRILLVDDEVPNLETMAALLRHEFKVTTCESAVEALEILNKTSDEDRFSAIISDHMMPKMTGIDFFKELKRRHHPTPRIIVTGFAELGNVIEAINEASIFRYLTKPVEQAVLVRTVAEAVANYEMREENGRLMGVVKELLEKSCELSKVLESHGLSSKVEELGLPKIGEPRRVDVAVLFADVRGFTKLSSVTGAREVITVLQRLFEPVHQIIYDAGGIVDKHLGDGLMAVFGLSGNASIRAAIETAHQIVLATPGIIKSLEPEFHDVKLSLGLAAGEVVMGVVGSARRSELAVIGQPANLAARLQEFSKVALANPESPLGEFGSAMAVCDGSMLVGESKFLEVPLGGDLTIRDFPDIAKVGVFSC